MAKVKDSKISIDILFGRLLNDILNIFELELNKYKLSLSLYGVLISLSYDNATPMDEIVKITGVGAASQFTDAIEELRNLGLVNLKFKDNYAYIFLTLEGDALKRQLRPVISKIEDKMLFELNDLEQRDVIRLLEKLKSSC